MAVWLCVVSVLLAISYSDAQCVQSVAGRKADPCNCVAGEPFPPPAFPGGWDAGPVGAQTRGPIACVDGTRYPLSDGFLFLLPSQTSPNYAASPIAQQANQAPFQVTIEGQGFLHLTAHPVPPAIPIPAATLGDPGRVCLGFPGKTCAFGCDATLAFAQLSYDNANANSLPDQRLFFPLPTGIAQANAWNTARLEVELLPRPLCMIPAAPIGVPAPLPPNNVPTRFLGVYVKTVWDCNPALAQQGCDFYNPTGAAYSQANVGFSLSNTQIAVLRARTQCCRPAVAPLNGILVGSCVNPNVQSCCGATPYTNKGQKCCNTIMETVTDIDGICPCSVNNDCPAGESCCVATKYPLLNLAVTPSNPVANARFFNNLRGQCFNPAYHLCCDTGARYDPGTHQCCPINGLQTVNEPCPCDVHTDCPGPRAFCCKATVPVPTTLLTNFKCDKFFNYPTGQGHTDNQAVCAGRCMDLTYQSCCNGAICSREYEKCCNNECCNLFHGTCLDAYVKRTQFFNHIPQFPTSVPVNSERTRCSIIENLHPIRAFWVFVLPSILAGAALLAAAIIIVYACKTDAKWTTFEKVVFAIMIIQLLLGLSILWSPIYRYAVLVIIGTLIEMVILAAVANVYLPPEVDRFLPSFALGFCAAGVIITQIIILVGIINPITGNALIDTSANSPIYQNVTECQPERCALVGPAAAQVLTCQPRVCRNVLRPRRNSVGLLNRDSGIWITVLNLYRREIECVQYYDYFQHDVRVLDLERSDNPEVHTFGFCSQGYLLAILILAALIVMVGLTLLGFAIAGFVYELLPQIAAPIF